MWNNYPKHQLERVKVLPQIAPPKMKYREIDLLEMQRRTNIADFSKGLAKTKLQDFDELK